jgi:hypothetical protein
MSLGEFQDELRRIARFDNTEAVTSPLNAAVRQISEHPNFSQSRLLCRFLHALADGRGEFRRAELAAFDTATLRIVIALMNAAANGANEGPEWKEAVAAADAAANG